MSASTRGEEDFLVLKNLPLGEISDLFIFIMLFTPCGNIPPIDDLNHVKDHHSNTPGMELDTLSAYGLLVNFGSLLYTMENKNERQYSTSNKKYCM